MEEREVAKLILSREGSSFNRDILRQGVVQNHINAINLFKSNHLNSPKMAYELVKDYPTYGRFSDPYTDSLIELNPNKTNLRSISTSKQAQDSSLSKFSYLALSLNNPYFYNLRETAHNQNEIDSHSFDTSNDDAEKVKFLTLLNDLKTLYIGKSFTDKTNKQRSDKINVLIDYFSNSNDENDLKLDDKECLVYRNLSTNTKFAIYVDYFIKYPNEINYKSLPLYFRELFLDKISNSQVKFHPTLHYNSKPTGSSSKKKIRKKIK